MNFSVDEVLVRRSLQLAADAVAHGNHPFGALLAKDGQILLEAENTVNTGHDVTNHAETNLVRLATQRYDFAFLEGCILYTSTEPCAMCSGAIYWSGVSAVVYACSAKRLGEIAGKGLEIRSREIFASGTRPVSVVGPVLEDEAAQVHLGYWNTK
ncbi:MAG: nucleoside deaminase [Chloroflexi bacterium]|nr:nucleoside deaminase [Chloroflexota bacterium]